MFVDDAKCAAHVRAAVPNAPPIVAFDDDGDDGFAALVRAGEALGRETRRWRRIYDGIGARRTRGADLHLGDDRPAQRRDAVAPQPRVEHGERVRSGESAQHEGQIALSVLPFAHIFEHTNALGYLYNRLVHYVTTPERLLEDLKVIRPNFVAFVPRIFERLIAGIVGRRAMPAA